MECTVDLGIQFCERCGRDRDALVGARAAFRDCPTCGSACCPDCWNLVDGGCLACAPFRLHAETSRSRIVIPQALEATAGPADAGPAAAGSMVAGGGTAASGPGGAAHATEPSSRGPTSPTGPAATADLFAFSPPAGSAVDHRATGAPASVDPYADLRGAAPATLGGWEGARPTARQRPRESPPAGAAPSVAPDAWRGVVAAAEPTTPRRPRRRAGRFGLSAAVAWVVVVGLAVAALGASPGDTAVAPVAAPPTATPTSPPTSTPTPAPTPIPSPKPKPKPKPARAPRATPRPARLPVAAPPATTPKPTPRSTPRPVKPVVVAPPPVATPQPTPEYSPEATPGG